MRIDEVLNRLENANKDTEYSKVIFREYEEGKQDEEVKLENKSRRDWIVIADIYNIEDGNDRYNQRFHLVNYLKFRLENGLKKDDDFKRKCYCRIRNAALILYIREVIFEEFKEGDQELSKLFFEVKSHYENGGKINDVSFASKIRY